MLRIESAVPVDVVHSEDRVVHMNGLHPLLPEMW
jgi:hypothetical protein